LPFQEDDVSLRLNHIDEVTRPSDYKAVAGIT
jgi:hypothetical protein